MGATSQIPYNADSAKNETSADILRLTNCLERMQLKLEDTEQRMQALQPKQRHRRGDYSMETVANVRVTAAKGWRGCNHDPKRSVPWQ
ncbi:Bifunctional protein HldE [Trichinella pseudospiralis]